MIPIDTDNRMKKITGNLKRDVKDLLGESANIVTGVFKRGACTVRVMTDKWKAFAHDISDAVDTLMKPSFAEGGPEAPGRTLDPEAEPVVTITESMDGKPAVGMQMPLSQANALIGQLDREYREAEYAPAQVTVRIDYMKDGQTDRYWLPLEVGAGGDLLEQMERRVESYRGDPDKVVRLFESVPETHREELRGVFTPAIQGGLNDLSTGVLQHFRRHCDIAEMEQQLQVQAAVLPEKEQAAFRETAKETVAALRRTTNGQPPEHSETQRETQDQPTAPLAPPEPQKEVQGDRAPERPARPQRESGPKPRQSVRVQLRQIKEDQATARPAARKVHVRPHQRGR